MGEIQDLADQFRTALLNREARAVLRIQRAYKPVLNRLDVEIGRLEEKIRKSRDRGETIEPVWLFQEDRLKTLKTAAEEELRKFGTAAEGEVKNAQERVLARVNSDGDKLLAAAAPSPGAGIEVQFSKLGEDALRELVGRASNGSPLADLFRDMSGQFSQEIEDHLITGLAIGLNPVEVVRGIRQFYDGPLARARTVARTEMLGAYREATKQRYIENREVLAGWTWVSVLGKNTCPACWAMHGSRHSVEERLDGHPNCRCVMAPLTKSWAELGFGDDIPDTRPVIPNGEEVFRTRSAEFQQGVLGKAGFAKWQSGELQLTDWIGRRDDPRWGTMRYSRSLRAIEKGTGGFQIGGNARGIDPTLGLTQPVQPARVPKAQQVREALAQKATEYRAERMDLKMEQDRLQAKHVDLLAQIRRLDNDIINFSSKSPEFAEIDRQATLLQMEIEKGKAAHAAASARLAGLEAEQTAYAHSLLTVEQPAELKPIWMQGYKRGDALRQKVETGIEFFSRFVSRPEAKGGTVGFQRLPSVNRSYYSPGKFVVTSSHKGAETQVIIHELGHWLEDVADLSSETHAFVARRTQGEAQVRLKDLFPNSNYKANELTRPDKFFNPYIGKLYPKASEVISMGLEAMYAEPYRFAAVDPDHFDFVYNIVRGIQP